MADLDVSELLNDPDFEDDFLILKSVELVGQNGRATFATMAASGTGVIQPARGRTLDLLPESARVQGVIEIWTQNRLRMNDGSRAADTVSWQGRHYIVANVEDFTNYGHGYIHATCTLQDLVGPADHHDDMIE